MSWPAVCSPLYLFFAIPEQGPNQIAGGERERELAPNALHAAQHGFGDRHDSLAPAEHLFDPFADAFTDGVAGTPRGSAVDSRRFGLWPPHSASHSWSSAH